MKSINDYIVEAHVNEANQSDSKVFYILVDKGNPSQYLESYIRIRSFFPTMTTLLSQARLFDDKKEAKDLKDTIEDKHNIHFDIKKVEASYKLIA